MNLASTLLIHGGGAGSGCNPEVGDCGRPPVGEAWGGEGKWGFGHKAVAWPRDGMDLLDKKPVLTTVKIADLYPTQEDDEIDEDGVQRYTEWNPPNQPPDVISYKGKMLLRDGHHRVAAALRRGEDTIEVDLYK